MSKPLLSSLDSYKNVHQILKQLQIFAMIYIVREGMFIGCDRRPYCLTSRIVESSPVESDFASLVPRQGRLRSHRFPVSNCDNKKLESNHQLNKQTNIASSVNESNGKSIRWLNVTE